MSRLAQGSLLCQSTRQVCFFNFFDCRGLLYVSIGLPLDRNKKNSLQRLLLNVTLFQSFVGDLRVVVGCTVFNVVVVKNHCNSWQRAAAGGSQFLAALSRPRVSASVRAGDSLVANVEPRR